MKRRRRTPLWKAEALTSLSERLSGLEVALRGRKVLEFRCGPDVGFGFLLDWLRPSRLVAVDVDASPAARQPGTGYGPVSSFDAAFLLARGQLKHALRRISLPELAQALTPGGLLVVTALGPRSFSEARSSRDQEIDRSAEAWSLLHASMAGSGFQITEEHLGLDRLLVARLRASPNVLSRRPALPARRPSQS
jgi:hypothetical protein